MAEQPRELRIHFWCSLLAQHIMASDFTTELGTLFEMRHKRLCLGDVQNVVHQLIKHTLTAASEHKRQEEQKVRQRLETPIPSSKITANSPSQHFSKHLHVELIVNMHNYGEVNVQMEILLAAAPHAHRFRQRTKTYIVHKLHKFYKTLI